MLDAETVFIDYFNGRYDKKKTKTLNMKMISLYFSEDSSSSSSSSVLILTLKPADVEQLMEETNNKQLVVDVNYQLSSRERKSVSVLPVCKVCERINTPQLSRTVLSLM